jgi:hypothetical protein
MLDPDPINRLGLEVLGLGDYRVVGIATVALYVVFSFVKLARHRAWPGTVESMRGVVAILSLFGAVSVCCVFLLTKPPAIDKLSDESRGLIGLICLVALSGLAFNEIKAIFIASKPPGSTPVPTNVPTKS